jgi:hypothetical protein
MIKHKRNRLPLVILTLAIVFVSGNLFAQGEITPHISKLIKPGTVLIYKTDKLGESGKGYFMVTIKESETGLAYQISGSSGKTLDKIIINDQELKTAEASAAFYAKASEVAEGKLIGLRMSDHQFNNYKDGLKYAAAGNMKGEETMFKYAKLQSYDILINNSVYRFPTFLFTNTDVKQEDRSRVNFISQTNFPLLVADHFHGHYLVAMYTDFFTKKYEAGIKCVKDNQINGTGISDKNTATIEKYIADKMKVPFRKDDAADVAITIHYTINAEGKVKNITPGKTEHINADEKIIKNYWVNSCIENAMWTVSSLPVLEPVLNKDGEKTCVQRTSRIVYAK